MGIAIAAPVGPIGLLCIRRTLAQGRSIGLMSGLGAATADGIYGIVAAFGLAALSELLVSQRYLLQIMGGLFLCYLGLATFFASSKISTADLDATATAPFGLLVAYASTLFLTLTNPATIFSFMAIFAGLGITQTDYLSSVTLVFGVFTGSASWWLVLVSGIVYFRKRLTPHRLDQFNQVLTKIFGVLILGFGLAAWVV